MSKIQNNNSPYNKRQLQQQPLFNINNKIRALEVRLVGENINPGVYSTRTALQIAEEQGLDLIEISSNGDTPICRVADYNKFLYEKKKKEKDLKAKSKIVEVKEIRFTTETDEHDFNFKTKHTENFLKDGNKVRAIVLFKGRFINLQERGQLMLLKLAEKVAEIGLMEDMPKMEGRKMMAIFSPKGNKKTTQK